MCLPILAAVPAIAGALASGVTGAVGAGVGALGAGVGALGGAAGLTTAQTVGLLASLAATGASTGIGTAQAESAEAIARAQSKEQEQQAARAAQQAAESASEERLRLAETAAETRGRAQNLGLSGGSLQRLLVDISRRQGRSSAVVGRNLEFATAQAGAQQRASQLNFAAERLGINASRPNPAVVGLSAIGQIGTGALTISRDRDTRVPIS